MKLALPAAVLVLALGAASACTANGGTAEPERPTGSTGAVSDAAPAPEGFVYVSLGDSWAEGAHCNGCRTFPQIHAEALEETLGEPVTLVDLRGRRNPFNTPGGGGSAGLLQALRTEEEFREEVAKGDIIMIETGSNDGGEIFEPIMGGRCGGKDDIGCVVPLAASGSGSSTRSSTRLKSFGTRDRRRSAW